MTINKKERRNSFRINFNNFLNGKAEILSINDKKINVNKIINLEILNISEGGLKTKTILDFPINIIIILELTFYLIDRSFKLKGRIISKNKNGNSYEYGIQFIDVIESEKQLLVKYLFNYQIKKVRIKDYYNSIEINNSDKDNTWSS
jgi:c-di-GMP-binding flagellar brake protein YcgR